MKVIEFDRFGDPKSVARCVERPDPEPSHGKVVLRMEVMAINPADLLTIEGRYGIRPDLPATPGAEGVGRIESIGEGVADLSVGDVVVPMSGSCWQERIVARPHALIPLPSGCDLDQAAMLKANPATAEALLTLTDLTSGDWVMQNAANSAVGRNLVLAAKDRGLKTVNIVRRPDPVADLEALGADAVIVHDGEGPEWLADQIGEITGKDAPRLAIDAIGGGATQCLAAAAAQSGLIVNYGLLSGEACRVDPFDLVFRDVRLNGFWLPKWFQTVGPTAARDLYARLTQRLMSGAIRTPVEARYPLDRISEALDHAARSRRIGKVLLTA